MSRSLTFHEHRTREVMWSKSPGSKTPGPKTMGPKDMAKVSSPSGTPKLTRNSMEAIQSGSARTMAMCFDSIHDSQKPKVTSGFSTSGFPEVTHRYVSSVKSSTKWKCSSSIGTKKETATMSFKVNSSSRDINNRCTMGSGTRALAFSPVGNFVDRNPGFSPLHVIRDKCNNGGGGLDVRRPCADLGGREFSVKNREKDVTAIDENNGNRREDDNKNDNSCKEGWRHEISCDINTGDIINAGMDILDEDDIWSDAKDCSCPVSVKCRGDNTKDIEKRRHSSRASTDSTSSTGSFHGLSDALQTLMRRDRMNSSSSLLTPEGLSDSRHNIRCRRMSTPQPIRSRQTRSTSTRIVQARMVIRRSRSAPDLADPEDQRPRRQRRDVFRMSSSTAGDLALQPHDFSSDEDSEDCVSYGAGSITGSTTSLRQQTTLEEIFEDRETPTYTEALWDHVTMDTEELGFRAGEVIEVLDLEDRDWWFGRMGDTQGWFPSAFVRLRANQVELVADSDMSTTTGSSGHLLLLATDSVSQTQARTNVVREILHAEREYVRHLKDVMQGYVEKCRKRPEMFTETTMSAIFGNIGAIHSFSTLFLRDLENHLVHEHPHESNLGQIFIKHSGGFEIYSEYCNNHPTACEELRSLTKNKKYTHFFEACRLLQDMIELPLEGFLLTPVQKICKYPLQLKELLKYTPPNHPDYVQLTGALETMRRIAVMINERKRKMESLEKLSSWQRRIEDWQGPNLLDQSSELIYTGDMTKVNNSGWHQDRVFFLFDHQLIYCKKDMLWRDLLIYKGRINLDNCIIKALPDEKDPVFNVHVKNGIRIYDNEKSKWYLLYCRNAHDRSRWFRAFQQERQRVEEDADNDFNLDEFRRKLNLSSQGKGKAHPSARYRERSQKRKKHRGRRTVYSDGSRPPPHQNSPPSVPAQDADPSETSQGKRWFNFGNKKNKR